LQQAGGSEFAKVAADGVLGHGEMLDQLRCGDLAVAFQQQQDLLFAQGRQVDGLMSVMHVCALYCGFVRD